MGGYHTSNNSCWKNKNDMGRQLDLLNKGIACSWALRKKIKRNARFCKISNRFKCVFVQ